MTMLNSLTDREMMGLSNKYITSRFNQLQAIYDLFVSKEIHELIALLESVHSSLEERFVAGQLLALRGDPRIKTLDPVMIEIPASSVNIGINENQIGRVLKQYEHVGVIRNWILKETPAHQVKLASFRIRKFLVTNQEYKDFLKDTHYEGLPTSWEFGVYPDHKANHPVYTITEKAAENYAVWLSEKLNRKFRLASEAEWEYAASGPDHFEYPWGNNYQTGFANTVEEKIFMTTPVGMFLEGNSYFGLSDMAGNVEEYVADDYQAYPNGVVIEDDLTSNGRYRVARGGSFTRYADLARTTRRHGHYNKAIYVMGFRLVEEI